MNSYVFSVALTGVPDMSDDYIDRLFKAGLDDTTLHVREGVAYLSFDRDADSLESAMQSALRDIERFGAIADLIEVEPADLPKRP